MLITGRKKLNQHILLELDQFLTQHETMSLIELQGFLTAIISGPDLIPPGEWLEAAGITDIDFESEEQARSIISSVMIFYNTIVKQLDNQTYQPLINLPIRELLQPQETIKQAAARWAQGYLMATYFDSDNWFEKPADEKEDEEMLATLLFPIFALALKDEILQEEIKITGMNKTPDEIREAGIQLLPGLANAIYDYWLAWRENQAIPQSTALSPLKIRRNDPCPCGSNKKYKKCCLH